MPSFLKVHGFVFETEALKDAYLAFPPAARNTATGYDENALEALLRYFADWGPVREDTVTASPAEGLEALSTDQKRELFNELTKRLSENLADQYGRDVDQQSFEGFLHRIAEEPIPQQLATFFLRYLWQTSKRIHEYEQDLLSAEDRATEIKATDDDAPDSKQTVAAIHRLPTEYLDQKREQYEGDDKINRIRFQVLEDIRSTASLTVETLRAYQESENEKHETDIMRAYDEFTVLGQLYYDYFKPRIDAYLQEITSYLIEELDIEESSAHLVNFVQPRNRLSDVTWFAIYPTQHGDKAEAYQLFAGIRWDGVRFGLYAGDEVREDGWRDEVDIDNISEVDSLTTDLLADKFDDVLQEYYRLNEIRSVEPPEKPPDDFVETVARQLRTEKQVVFYGPPGTGKTYRAQQFANWWVHDQTDGQPQEEQVQAVTFHPSFSYEDYIEGLTAEVRDGNVSYEIDDGVFKRVADSARAAYSQASENDESAPPYLLIIDEINRGNLGQIFGETITQLEADKRLGEVNETVVQLAHSDDSFDVPPNLYLIGTMNTADRSIALVDTALRRRFRFIGFPPAFGDVVDEYDLPGDPLQSGNEFQSLLWVSIVALQEMNDRIVRSADIGKGKQIGHSRLFGLETVTDIRDIWRYDILPLLEEYYFGQFDRIRQELFDGEGDELFDWERKQIRNFTVQELGDALGSFTDEEIELSRSGSNTDETSRTGSRREWDRESFFEEVESSFESEVVDVYRDLYEFGATEADSVDYGTGVQTGAIQFYWDEYREGKYLVYEIRTDGRVQFRFWGRQAYDEEVFEEFLEDSRDLVEDPVDVDYLISDDFSGLQVPIERLRDEENREQLKEAIREFVDRCASQTP